MTRTQRVGQSRGRLQSRNRNSHGHRLHRARQYGTADGAPADRGRPQAHRLRHAQRRGRAAGGARRPARIVARRCRRPGRDGDGEPAVAADLAKRSRPAKAASFTANASSASSICPPPASRVAAKIAAALAKKNIVQIDSPVSGGVGGANKGTLAVMVSGPQSRNRYGEGCARGVRQGLRHRREARHGADHEARQ